MNSLYIMICPLLWAYNIVHLSGQCTKTELYTLKASLVTDYSHATKHVGVRIRSVNILKKEKVPNLILGSSP